MQHRPFSVIANCEYNEAGCKEKGKRDEAAMVVINLTLSLEKIIVILIEHKN